MSIFNIKKFLSLLLPLCLLLSFCACSSLPAAADYASVLLKPYTAFVRITDGDSEYAGQITLSSDGKLDFVFAEPTLLCGIGYRFEGSESCIVYKDIDIPLKSNALQTGTGVCTWRDMLTPDGEHTVQRVEQDEKEKILLSDGETEYYFSAADKTPLMITRGDITIIFTEFKNTESETAPADTEYIPNETIPEGTGGN